MNHIPTKEEYEAMCPEIGPWGRCRQCGQELFDFPDYDTFREFCQSGLCVVCQGRYN